MNLIEKLKKVFLLIVFAMLVYGIGYSEGFYKGTMEAYTEIEIMIDKKLDK